MLPGRQLTGIRVLKHKVGERTANVDGLQAILTYYLLYTLNEGGLGLDPSIAVGIVGAYGGGVYVTQLLGGWLADRVVRPQNLVAYGSVIIICGHLSLASIPGLTGVGVGLPLIALGTGALKSNGESPFLSPPGSGVGLVWSRFS